jgi:hypothetical protein
MLKTNGLHAKKPEIIKKVTNSERSLARFSRQTQSKDLMLFFRRSRICSKSTGPDQ